VTWLTLIPLAVGLGMDAFAVAIAVGAAGAHVCFRPVFRLSFHFGLFQFLMPIVGWSLGLTIVQYISAYDHWVALGLLSFVGVRMIIESRSGDSGAAGPCDPTRGWSLIVLSIATSIDALAVGLTMAFLQVDIWIPCVVIGIVAAGMTALGMLLGARLGERFGKRMALVGGLVLIGIGLKILYEHLS